MRAARLPVSERKQAPLVEAHAFDHYLRGPCGGRFPLGDNARTDMRCPMCLRWLPRADFSLEHAPQWAHQSRLGPPWLLVSTCKPCNSAAGSTFESVAASVTEEDRAIGNDPLCRVHGTAHGGQTFNAGWMSSHEAVSVADLKSAYLIAFAVLGYSWATSRRLDPLRTAIATGRTAGSADALETCGLVADPSAGRTVWEVSEPVPMILVVAPASEMVVALPVPGNSDVGAACHAISGCTITFLNYPWPLMVRETERTLGVPGFHKPEDAWDASLTFHLDRCDKPHATTVNPNRLLTRAANRRFRASPLPARARPHMPVP